MSDCCWQELAVPGKTVYGSLGFEEQSIPVAVAAGRAEGPVLLVTGMQHATEFSGPAALDCVLARLDPAALKGTLVGMPFVNPFQMRATHAQHAAMHSKPETNLNRQWAKRDQRDNQLTRLAAHLWDRAICHADALLDMHCCRDIDPRFAACLEGHAASEALAVAVGLDAVDLQAPGSYDARQLMLAASHELDMPALLVESRPDGYQTPEAVTACARSIFRALRHLGMLDNIPALSATRGCGIFSRATKGVAVKAQQAGYLGLRLFPGSLVDAGEAVAVVRSLETFAVLEDLVSPLAGGVCSVGENEDRPFVSSGATVGYVKSVAFTGVPQNI